MVEMIPVRYTLASGRTVEIEAHPKQWEAVLRAIRGEEPLEWLGFGLGWSAGEGELSAFLRFSEIVAIERTDREAGFCWQSVEVE